jgi:hypothetical protein
MLDDVLMGVRFLRQLPAFLRRPVTVEEARATLKRRLENRERDFLVLAKRAIYEHPPSPYRALLQLAGCEHGDLARLVRQQGVEGALRSLLRHGVYLTVNEFKGREPIRRGSTRLVANPGGVRNPASVRHGLAASSGSRGRPTVIPLDLRFVRDLAVTTCVAFDERRALDWVYSRWAEPGHLGLHLVYPGFGLARPLVLPVDPTGAALHPRYRWSGQALRLGSRLAGVPLRAPSSWPSRLTPILRWPVGVSNAAHAFFSSPTPASRTPRRRRTTRWRQPPGARFDDRRAPDGRAASSANPAPRSRPPRHDGAT